MDTDVKIIDLTPDNIAEYGVCGYKDVKKHKELRNKIAWFKEYYPKGLRIKVVVSESGGYRGMLEYIPGKLAHRPVNAENYMFIHCVFVGLKKEHKGKGYASALIRTCINDAKSQKMLGVAVVTRKGSFMVNKEIFLKHDFEVTDTASPDFELLMLKFDPEAKNPSFKKDVLKESNQFSSGLTVLRSPQCPYTEKNVNAIIESAQKKHRLETYLVELPDADAAQHTPCAFGTFCILYEGEVISHHPISSTRFENILESRK